MAHGSLHTLLLVGRRLRVNAVMKGLVRLAPAPLRRRFEAWVRRIKVRGGYRRKLVPEAALEARYRECLQRLVELGGEAGVGDYLEFGVCHGTSLLCMHRALQTLGLERVRLFGFDSFEGLPDTAANDDEGTWKPGQFDSDYELTRRILSRAGVDWDRVHLVRGWYRDTLDETLIRRHGLERAGVIMIDCDMYLSAIEALRFCGPLIAERAIVVFDDWHADLARRNLGEKRAFDEFLSEHPELAIEELPGYGAASKVFLVERVQGKAPRHEGTEARRVEAT